MYRALNEKTPLDGFPMPQEHDVLESLHGAVYLSTLDLRSEYWQVEIDQQSIPKTAFVRKSKTNQYEFFRIPFGLKNSVATFQRLMNTVLSELLGSICFVYIDDIVIYSHDLTTHLEHIQQVFMCLQRPGLTLKMKKCQLCQHSLTFLGHVIAREGNRMEAGKVEAIQTCQTPRNLKELQRFIGLAGWYHRFIPRLSE